MAIPELPGLIPVLTWRLPARVIARVASQQVAWWWQPDLECWLYWDVPALWIWLLPGTERLARTLAPRQTVLKRPRTGSSRYLLSRWLPTGTGRRLRPRFGGWAASIGTKHARTKGFSFMGLSSCPELTVSQGPTDDGRAFSGPIFNLLKPKAIPIWNKACSYEGVLIYGSLVVP